MSTQQSPREPAPMWRARRRARPGQSIVEYALTLAMIFLVVQGTGRAVYDSFVTVVTNLRSTINVSDDPTPTNGPSPTVRLPPAPPTLTALPPSPTVIAMCEVPDLTDYQYNAAVAEWLNYGFKSGTLTRPSGSSSTFLVGSQSLLKGAYLACDTTTMHVTPKQCPVPDLEGQTFSAARDGAWTTNGFAAGNLQHPGNISGDFAIASQEHVAGIQIDCDTTMLVAPGGCTVPDMDGLMFDDVSGNNELFGNAGFTSALDSAWGNTNPRNRRIGSSNPPANALIPCDSAVTVYEKMCIVPNLTGVAYSAATANDGPWGRAGFTFNLGKAWSGNQDRVIGSTSPGAGAQVACSSGSVTASTDLPTATPTASQVIHTATPTRTPITATNTPISTPTPDPQSLVVTIEGVSDGASYSTSSSAPSIEARAYDPAVGTSNGRGIDRVEFSISGPGYSESRTERQVAYCAFGGDSPCALWSDWSSLTPGSYTITATAYSSNGRPSASTSATITVVSTTPTNTPTPTTQPLIVSIEGVADGATYGTSDSAPRVEARAYDPNVGTSNGQGIDRVEFSISGPSFSHTQTERSAAYCGFGGSSPCPQWSGWSSLTPGSYTITATAYSSNGRPSASTSATITIAEQPLVVSIVGVTDGQSYSRNNDGPRLEAEAYDPNVGTSNGSGISQVRFAISGPNGYSVSETDSGARYCTFGYSSGWDRCYRWSSWSSLDRGYYTITVTASSSNGRPAMSESVTIRVTN